MKTKIFSFDRIWKWSLCSVTCRLLHSITSSAVSILIHQSGLFQAPITLVHNQILWYICHRYVKTTSNTSVNWHDTAMRWVLRFETTYSSKHVKSAGGWMHLPVWSFYKCTWMYGWFPNLKIVAGWYSCLEKRMQDFSKKCYVLHLNSTVINDSRILQFLVIIFLSACVR